MFKFLAKIVSKPKVFNWLYARSLKTPYTHITQKGESSPYMYRYWLFNPYLRGYGLWSSNWFPFSVRIHHIMQKDLDRHLHDHPWNVITFILKGWYTEIRGDGEQYLRTAGGTASLNFGEYHKILEVSEGGVFTLFVTFKYQGVWGFLVNNKKVPYKKYLNLE